MPHVGLGGRLFDQISIRLRVQRVASIEVVSGTILDLLPSSSSIIEESDLDTVPISPN